MDRLIIFGEILYNNEKMLEQAYQEELIGRKEEKEILERALTTQGAEMVAVIGRRRVGKTFLVNQVYTKHIIYYVTGIQNASLKEQLNNFTYQLNQYANTNIPYQIPSNWLEAFQMLIAFTKERLANNQEKAVIFLDELPWLATHKSGFLKGLSFFWNSWAVRENLVLVICGSAASWMIRRVVHHRGGLHNRITKRIFLEPFTLSETRAYLESRNLHFDLYQIIQLYMAMGGIPHYLKEIEKGKSATQNINQICFSKNGMLSDEFLKLYPSLFSNAEKHISIIRALAQKRQGLTRKELASLGSLSEGGNLQRILEELEQSGFIATYRPFGKKKKEKLYRLIDEYSLFYLQFIEHNEYEGADTWNHLSQTNAYKIWSGYAFESICIKHLVQIKKALSIAGIYARSASFYKKGTAEEKGAQIDLVLERGDQVINLFEIKFSNEIYTISKSYYENLINKKQVFKRTTRTKKQLSFVFVSTFGIQQNQYSTALVSNSLTMEDLFE